MSQPLCFVIGPIGEEGSDFRQHADDLFDLIIKPVVESTEFGYRADRADKIRKPGHITNQIIKMIKEADLVVADLSHRNPNAFYELALRHALGTPIIHMIRDADTIPFDVTSYRTIKFNLDLRGGEKAKAELANQVRSTKEDGFEPQNPILDALGVIELEKSSNPVDNAQAVVLQSITDLRNQVTELGVVYANLYDYLASKIQFTQPQYFQTPRVRTAAETKEINIGESWKDFPDAETEYQFNFVNDAARKYVQSRLYAQLKAI